MLGLMVYICQVLLRNTIDMTCRNMTYQSLKRILWILETLVLTPPEANPAVLILQVYFEWIFPYLSSNSVTRA